MAHDAVADAFEAKIGNPWNGLPVEGFDEVLSDPPANENGFIAVQFVVVNRRRLVLGRKFAEEGTASFVLNIRREVGLRQGRQWASQLADLLRATEFDGVETLAPSGPVEINSNDNGNYTALAVMIPYRYQFDDEIINSAAVTAAAGSYSLSGQAAGLAVVGESDAFLLDNVGDFLLDDSGGKLTQ